MFDHLERSREIEGLVAKRKSCRGRLYKTGVGKAVVRARIADGVFSRIDSGDRARAARQLSPPVSGAGPYIEDAQARDVARGEGIAGYMFSPEIVIDLAGDHPLAGEFAHRAAPAPSFEFTSTRQGKWNCPYACPSAGPICSAIALSIQSQIA